MTEFGYKEHQNIYNEPVVSETQEAYYITQLLWLNVTVTITWILWTSTDMRLTISPTVVVFLAILDNLRAWIQI